MKSLKTYKELEHRLDQIVGVPFSELARYSKRPWKGGASQNKGWGGTLVDLLVGADAGNAPAPDLTTLGVEVKTIPIDRDTSVQWPTKVTSLNYADVSTTEWWESTAFHKLRAVLFVPIVKLNAAKWDDWFIRRPFLWLPPESVLEQFKEDYDSVRALINSGEFERISSANPPKGQGKYLHPKPAAQNSAVRRDYEVKGTTVRLLPRAWMLRESFTQPIVTEGLRLDLQL